MADNLEQRLDELLELQWPLHQSFPAYRHLPEAALRRSGSRNAQRIVSALRGATDLPGGAEHERATGAARAAQQVPVNEMVELQRHVFAVLCDAFVETCATLGVSGAATVQGLQRLWHAADSSSSEVLDGYYSEQLRVATHQESMRASFTLSLLHGWVTADRAATQLVLGYGVRQEGEYYIVRTAAGESALSQGQLQRRAAAVCHSSEFEPLVVTLEDDVIAISATSPRRWEAACPLIVSDAVTPAEFPVAVAKSGRALAAAQLFNLHGVRTVSSLSVRTAVVEQPGIGEGLHERLIEPVLATRGGAELLRTVEAYLEHGRHIGRTAAALFVHVNTVRYRLGRMRELTGLDFERLDDLVELWWALAHRRGKTHTPSD